MEKSSPGPNSVLLPCCVFHQTPLVKRMNRRNTRERSPLCRRTKPHCFALRLLPGTPPLPAVAEAIVQLLPLDFVEGRHFSIGSKQGDGPGQDAAKWRDLFAACAQQPQRAGVA